VAPLGVLPDEEEHRRGSRLPSPRLWRGTVAAHPVAVRLRAHGAYLESSNPANIPLYQGHGFDILDTIQVGSSPPIFPHAAATSVTHCD